MITNEQKIAATQEALRFVAENPLETQAALREHLQGWMLTTFAAQLDYWTEATETVLEEIVVLKQRQAFATADAAAQAARDAKTLADWEARMAVPVPAAPVYATTVTPVAPKTHQDHIEAIKEAYSGTDPDNQTFNLYAACRYALLNGLSADDVANTVNRPKSECHNLMYPS